MQSSRNFVLAATVVLSPMFTILAPVQAQTQPVTRPQVFKESNAMSGQGTQRWSNDRDADRDRDRDRRDRDDRDHRYGDHRDQRDGTVIIGNPNTYPPGNTVIVPVYPGYAPYPTYGPSYGAPAYPSYPYGYNVPQSGASVTVSTPGYNDGTFNVFPWSSTVTTFGPAPGYYGNYPSCPPYPNYPAYPTYVPNVSGYRGAATPGYYYNGGSYPSGAFITGSTNGYSTGFSAGYSTGRTTITIGGRR